MKVTIVEPQLGTQQAPGEQGLKVRQHTPGNLGSLGQPPQDIPAAMHAGVEEESKGKGRSEGTKSCWMGNGTP